MEHKGQEMEKEVASREGQEIQGKAYEEVSQEEQTWKEIQERKEEQMEETQGRKVQEGTQKGEFAIKSFTHTYKDVCVIGYLSYDGSLIPVNNDGGDDSSLIICNNPTNSKPI